MARKKPRQDHPTRRTVIKAADVDVLMVPLVNWLNALDETTTLYCCQGDPGDEPARGPYVLFTCTNPLQLMRVLDALGRVADVSVYYDREFPVLRYSARFPNRAALALPVLGG